MEWVNLKVDQNEYWSENKIIESSNNFEIFQTDGVGAFLDTCMDALPNNLEIINYLDLNDDGIDDAIAYSLIITCMPTNTFGISIMLAFISGKDGSYTILEEPVPSHHGFFSEQKEDGTLVFVDGGFRSEEGGTKKYFKFENNEFVEINK